MPRSDGRALDALRPVEMIVGFHRPAEGSVLYRAGGTVVLCTASVDDKVPPFLEGKNQGWLTAEYQMHPRANPKRQAVAATSVGYVEGLGHALDLCYVEDSRARVDLNVVATASAKIVEVQGTAEGEPVERREMDAMVDLALAGIGKLVDL